MTTMRIAAGLFLLTIAYPASAQNAASVEKGRQLFLGMCSRCHGVEGGGGEGPNLNRPVLARAPNEEALRTVIRDGIPDRGMPRSRRLSESEFRDLVIFVRSLARAAAKTSAGSSTNGRVVYQRLGCASCHVVGGEGGTLGPELTGVGARRAPEYLRQAVVDPAAALPHGIMPVPGRGFNEFLPVHVVTNDGHEVRGVRVNEDSFTIQVRDAGNQLHSFRKVDLRQLDKEIGKSLMPDYKARVSGSELDDLVAYLSSLAPSLAGAK